MYKKQLYNSGADSLEKVKQLLPAEIASGVSLQELQTTIGVYYRQIGHPDEQESTLLEAFWEHNIPEANKVVKLGSSEATDIENNVLIVMACKGATPSALLNEELMVSPGIYFEWVLFYLPAGWEKSNEYLQIKETSTAIIRHKNRDTLSTVNWHSELQGLLAENAESYQWFSRSNYFDLIIKQAQALQDSLLLEKEKVNALKTALMQQSRAYERPMGGDAMALESVLRRKIENRLQQMEQLCLMQFEHYFSAEHGWWMKSVKEEIGKISTLSIRKQKNAEILRVDPHYLSAINHYFKEVMLSLQKTCFDYAQTAILLCMQEIQFVYRKTVNCDMKPADISLLIGQQLSLPEILQDPFFEAKINSKGIYHFLMASRKAPMYLMMFVSIFGISGISLSAAGKSDNSWIQTGLISLILLAGLYAWQQYRRERTEALELHLVQAKEKMITQIQKSTELYTKNLFTELNKTVRRETAQYAEQTEQFRMHLQKKEIIEIGRRKRSADDALKYCISQEKILDDLLRRLNNIEMQNQKELLEFYKNTKSERKKVL